MIILSGFADESALEKTIDQQFSAFAALGLKYFSIRFVDAGNGVKNVMQLDDTEVEHVLRRMDDYGLRVSSVGSPIGKVKLLDVEDGTSNQYFPFEEYLETSVRRACELAQRFNSQLIRGFSFYHPVGTSAEDHISEAADRLKMICQVCDDFDLTFGLEVEANLVGQNADNLKKIFGLVNHPALSLIFDGGNLVTQGYTTSEIVEQFKVMLPMIGWIHIKDYLHPGEVQRIEHVDEESLRHFVPASLGQSGHEEILQILKSDSGLASRLSERGLPGLFVDLEPHVRGGGQFGGFSGPDGFGVALRDFCQVLDKVGLEYQLREYLDL